MNSLDTETKASRKMSVVPADAQGLLKTVFIESVPTNEGVSVDRDYLVRIPIFEGPLDLLLHLIRKEQIDIHDIPVYKICKSYLEHLELMRQFDVNIAGEYMVMAATLTFLKSQTLLPKEQEEAEEEDPRLPLVAQLLEYERFKKAATAMNEIPWLYRDHYPRPAGAVNEKLPKEILSEGPIEPVDTYQLLVCLKVAQDRTHKPPVEIQSPALTLSEKVAFMGERLIESSIVDFSMMTPPQPPKVQVVMAFLAMLELARLKFIEIIQHENYGPIQIRSIRPVQELDMGLLNQF